MTETSSFAGLPALESHRAPVHIGSVALTVRDLGRTAEFYQTVIGLQVVESPANHVELGNDGVTLLRLTEDRHADIAPSGTPGLFHTAFVLPTRRDLGLWLRTAHANGWKLDGMADHLVSEAVYLADPEGNGIEIYVDRPRDQWVFIDGHVRMANVALDTNALVALAIDAAEPGTRHMLPRGARIGHVHLNVTDLASASTALDQQWGMDEMCVYPGALFFGFGEYHHHIATNIWNAHGPITRKPGQLGLSDVRLIARDSNARALLADRWTAVGGVDDGDAVTLTTMSGLNFSLARV
jgi:catechol 2,3-dioxygenase